VEYFKYLGNMIAKYARCTRQIALAKEALGKKKVIFISKLDLNLRKKLINRYSWSIALCNAETLRFVK
jgi:hypothetical protein